MLRDFIKNNFLIKFLNNHSRYAGFNLKNFNFIWNIKETIRRQAISKMKFNFRKH